VKPLQKKIDDVKKAVAEVAEDKEQHTFNKMKEITNARGASWTPSSINDDKTHSDIVAATGGWAASS
jgi:hypothetical protein